MIPFVATQVRAIIESIRLLESLVTAPLGLYSDIKMVRESLPFPEAAALSREETQERRTAFMTLTDTPHELALGTISSISTSLEILEATKGPDGTGPLAAPWVAQARRVLARAQARVGGDMRAKSAAKIQGLYVIVDPEATGGRPVAEVAEATLSGGASVLQLHDKVHDQRDALAMASQLKALCDRYDSLFVMNGDPVLAVSSDSHGLHLGQSDLPVTEARRILTPRQLVGSSNNSHEEAMESQTQGVDYLALGAVYGTATLGKANRPAVGLELVSSVKSLVSQPVVAVGGINAGNVAEAVRAGADCVCVVSAVTLAEDPEAATQELVEAIQSAKG